MADQNLKIGEYVLDRPLRSENSGFSEWGFGRKDGQTYFIKRFLSPVYPPENGKLGKRIVDKKKAMCSRYESEKQLLFWKINEVSDGNLLRIHEFFRYGTHYYITTEKVEAMDFEKEVLRLSIDEKIVLMKVLCHALSSLHKAGLIHGDIKLNNVLFYRTEQKTVSAKIIDIDSCFWKDNPPENSDELIGDFVYLSPDYFKFMTGRTSTVLEQIDIFSMGLVFHELLTGKLPDFDHEKYMYLYESVLAGQKPVPDPSIPPQLRNFIQSMLWCTQEVYPDAWSLLQELRLMTQGTVRPTPQRMSATYIPAPDPVYKGPAPKKPRNEDDPDVWFHAAGDL